MTDYDMHYGASAKIFEQAKILRNNMTKAEKLLWDYLSRKQLMGFKFRRQHPIADFIVDFYCHIAKLVIELDGEIHNNKEQKDYDKARTEELEEFGIKIIRFDNEEILKDIDKVLGIIERHLPLNPLKGT